MKKRRHGGYHIQERVGPEQFFLGEGGKRVFKHREALVFLTPHDAAEHIRKNDLSPLWEIVLCDCPPSEW
jgi:hypothetical protein